MSVASSRRILDHRRRLLVTDRLFATRGDATGGGFRARLWHSLGDILKILDSVAFPRQSMPLSSALLALVSLTVSAWATAGSVTYTNPSCSSFVVSGTPPTQTITCVAAGAVPVCAPTASPASPQVGQQATISANCSNGPSANGYVWTGGTCAGHIGSTCTVVKSRPVSVIYSVSASNAAGPGTAAQITVTWQ